MGPPCGELAKAMVTYTVPKMAMEIAREHSAVGMEDESATKSFVEAMRKFQKDYDAAFDDMQLWAFPADGAPMSTSKIVAIYADIKSVVICLAASLARWSPAAIQENVESITDCIKNFMLFMQLFGYVLIYEMHVSLAEDLDSQADVVTPLGSGEAALATAELMELAAAVADPGFELFPLVGSCAWWNISFSNHERVYQHSIVYLLAQPFRVDIELQCLSIQIRFKCC